MSYYGPFGYGHTGYGPAPGYGYTGYGQPVYGQPVSRFPPYYGQPVSRHEQVTAPLQQVVVENPVEEVSFLKPHDPLPSGVSVLLPHDPLPIEASNSIRSIGTGEEEDMYADIENQLIRLLDESD